MRETGKSICFTLGTKFGPLKTFCNHINNKNSLHLGSTCVTDATLKYFYIIHIIHSSQN